MSTDLRERGASDVLDASYASLFNELSGAFRARGLDPEEARDLAQESLVRTFVHLKRHGQTRPDLRPLAHTIAKRLYVERGRRARPQFVDLPQAEEVVDPAPQPADAVVALEQQRDVHAALRALGPRHRRVISLWMGGLRPAEIARELGIKRNAADALLHRARRQLATKLDPSQTAFGLLGILVLRLRSGVRRMVDAVTSLDPSGSITQAGAGLAVAGVAAIILVTSPAGDGVRGSQASRPQTSVASVSHDADASLRIASTEPAQHAVSVPPDVREAAYQMGARQQFRNPATGDEDEISLEFEYFPEREGIGVLDPVMEPAVRLTCGVASGACAEGG